MSLEEKIRSLNDSNLTTVELVTTLNTLHAQKSFSDTQSILLCSVLLNKIILQTYNLLDDATQNVINELLTNKIGVMMLIRAIKCGMEDNTTEINNTFIYIHIFLQIISKNIPLLIADITKSSIIDLESGWKPLLTVKITDCLGSILIWLFDHTPPASITMSRDLVKEVMKNYSTTIVSEMFANSADDVNQLSLKRYIVVYFLNKEVEDTSVFKVILHNWSRCKNLFTINSDTNNKKQGFVFAEHQIKFLLGVFKMMNLAIQDLNESCACYLQLIESLLMKIKVTNYKNSILKACEKNENIIVTYIWLYCMGPIKTKYLDDLLNKFGNKEYISSTTSVLQKKLTRFIILLLSNMTDHQLEQISCNNFFLDTITNRLESKVPMFREFGMYVADYIYLRINGEPMFKITSYEAKKNEFMSPINELRQFLGRKFDGFENDEQIIQMIEKQEKQIVDKASASVKDVAETKPIMIEMNYESDNDDSDLDDPTVSRKPTVAKPVFLKDLLHYLTTDPQKDKTAYEKRSIAFSIGIELVRIKKNTPEMNFYATKLVDAAINLDSIGFPIKENQEFTDDEIKIAFDSWKLSFLIAICSSASDVVFDYFFANFIKQDWVIPLRVQILSCIGLSCREQCGRKDDFVWGKNDLNKVQSKQLAGLGHETFSKLDDSKQKKIVDLDQLEKENRLIDALENTVISEGTVLRKSRKLDIDKEQARKYVSNTLATTFINKKLPKIYYSLITIWQEVNSHTFGNGFVMGSMSEYLNSHYIEILSMVYACSVPYCIDAVEMTIEQISVIVGVLRAIQASPSSEFPSLLFKSVITGLRLLLTENEKTLNIIRSSDGSELTVLLETYGQVLSESPPLDEPLNTLSALILQQLQQYSLIYS